ncbi:hypothetical protein GGE61_004888 [Rhizobium leguminosarum]|uniref:hypothetical protein n=1 Tax=Rhizobium leguminosarum TaxID=384 RepID=UPI0016211F78|nr:hypothetical protein [Rhizobium leguminosarum]MBB4388543.1 hypothetical protein [Rhizobium leguminosarum]
MDLDSIRPIFFTNGVRSALVVDDAFDPSPAYDPADLDRAFQLIEEQEPILEAFIAAGGLDPTDTQHLEEQLQATPQLEQALRDAMVDAPEGKLASLARAIYGANADDTESKLRPLRVLQKLLSDLNIGVTPVGSKGPAEDKTKYPLIFLDYFLGDKGAPSVEKSRDKIREIVKSYKSDEMPIVVLMSSELTKESLALAFRDSANLLGCQFKFVMKGEIQSDGFEFVTSLADLVQFIKQTRTIGDFVISWKEALVSAMDDFGKNIGQLDLHDYFQIRTKMGDDAARRFGDHVSGLFDGYLRKLIEDKPALKKATDALNKIDLSARPPAPFMPSEVVTQLGHAAAFQSPPTAVIRTDGMPDIELGDVFLGERIVGGKNKIEVAVVMSQTCDLEHANTTSILMVRGTATQRTSKKLSSGFANRPIMRTDLFHHDGKDLIIEWDAGSLLVEPVGSFNQKMKDMGYERVARLRPLHALALQQKFASHLTRVGMPDTPPAYRYPGVEVVAIKGTSKHTLISVLPKSQRQACVVGDEGQEVVLQESLLRKIREALMAIDPEGWDGEKLEKAKHLFSDVSKLRALRNHQLKSGKASFEWVSVLDREKSLEAGENLPSGCWLAICLLDKP